jgi:hypothetical protein
MAVQAPRGLGAALAQLEAVGEELGGGGGGAEVGEGDCLVGGTFIRVVWVICGGRGVVVVVVVVEGVWVGGWVGADGRGGFWWHWAGCGGEGVCGEGGEEGGAQAGVAEGVGAF